MDIRELKYFIQIADSASYSSAAEKLYISQPALSKVIQKMEEEQSPLMPDAAHDRTDISDSDRTEASFQNDENIMNDPNF